MKISISHKFSTEFLLMTRLAADSPAGKSQWEVLVSVPPTHPACRSRMIVGYSILFDLLVF
jgi:hypothetical protein